MDWSEKEKIMGSKPGDVKISTSFPLLFSSLLFVPSFLPLISPFSPLFYSLPSFSFYSSYFPHNLFPFTIHLPPFSSGFFLCTLFYFPTFLFLTFIFHFASFIFSFFRCFSFYHFLFFHCSFLFSILCINKFVYFCILFIT